MKTTVFLYLDFSITIMSEYLIDGNERGMYFFISDTGNRGTVSCGTCTKIHCSKKKASASWDKVLNILFRMSEDIPDGDEIESTYSIFHPPALSSRQPFSPFSAFLLPFLPFFFPFCLLPFPWYFCIDSSVFTGVRRRPGRMRTLLPFKLTHGKTVPRVPLSFDIWTVCDQRPRKEAAATAALTRCSPWQQRFSAVKCFALLI